jgi:transcriptional regulator
VKVRAWPRHFEVEVYLPAAFSADDAWAVGLIERHPLAHVIVATPDGLVASPVPLVRRGDALVGHVARPNTLWRHPGPVLAVFTGADAYVSPSWYPSKADDGKVVPTWNYETAHVHGTMVVHDDAEWKGEVVEFLTTTFESPRPRPWRPEDAPSDYIESLLRGIVGLELVDMRIEGKRKMSQNKAERDRSGVAAALADGDDGQRAAARAMEDSSS